MDEPALCPTCRNAIPADAPGGACPQCLLGAGLPGATPVSDPAPQAAAPPPSADEVEAKLQGFEILSVVGHGGMGVVYKARQKALDRVVALKVLPPAVAAAPGFAERFAREARALARLTHANIVAVHDFGETDGLCWLVMEYVDGLNVREAMRAGRIGPREALAIVPQICDALQYAHDRGVVHRDVKPENVLIDREGRVKVADFGLAKLVGRDTGNASLTGAQQVMGTLHYMAPEQWRTPKDVDHRADIFSLGVVFYEMLTGELPLGRFEPPSQKAAIDVRIDEVVLRSLERERDRRWQHVSDVRTKVDEIARSPELAPQPPTPAPPPPFAAAPVAAPPADATEDPVSANAIGAVVLFTVAAVGTVGAILAETTWMWWVVGSAVIGGAACVSTFVAERAKRAQRRLPAAPSLPDLPRELWLSPRALGLVGAATVALVLTTCSGSAEAAGGFHFGPVAMTLGLILVVLLGVRWEKADEKDPAKRRPLEPPVLIEVVSGGAILVGVLWLAAAVFSSARPGSSADDDGAPADDPAAAVPLLPPPGDAPAPWDFAVDTGKEGAVSSEAQRSELWRTWTALQAIHGRVPFESLQEMYEMQDWNRLSALSTDERELGAREGSLGLPLLARESLGSAPLSKFRIEKVSLGSLVVGGIYESAHVVASDGRRRLRFSMLWGMGARAASETWYFAAGPCEVE